MKGKLTISHSYGRCMGETGQSTEGCVINIHDKMAKWQKSGWWISLKTITSETEAVVNSRPYTETISDVSSPIAMSPSKLLAVKSNVLMPSPEKLDLYAIKQRRQVQQIAIERSSNKSSVRAEMEQTQKEFSDGRYCAPEGQSPQKNTQWPPLLKLGLMVIGRYTLSNWRLTIQNQSKLFEVIVE